MKMNKRITSLVLAMGVMVGTSSVFATPITDLETLSNISVDVKGTVTLPIIKVTLPTTATFKIDPYNTAGKGQIASTEFKVINESDVAIDVILNEFKVTQKDGIEKEKEIVLATTDKISPTSVKKDVFIHLDVKDVDFVAKDHAKRIVKVGKGLNEKLGEIAKKPTSGDAEELVLNFAGVVNSNAIWAADDEISIVPVFKIAPQVVVAP